MVPVKLKLFDEEEKEVMALLDTGAEVNLVRRGIIPEKYFRRSQHPKRFVTANHGVMAGGLTEVPCELLMEGMDIDTGEKVSISKKMAFYDGDVGVDVLLSYEWMATMDVEVHCRRHGLMVNRIYPQGPVWVAGKILRGGRSDFPSGVRHIMQRGRGKGTSSPAQVRCN